MWKRFVRDYLTFTRSQRRGLFILGGIIIVCKTLPLLFPYFISNKKKDTQAFDKEAADFLALQGNSKTLPDSSSQTPIRLFHFDPNTLSEEKWTTLGVSAHTAVTIRHYLNAGGHFSKKEDLKKIYGLSQKKYQQLAPYIRIKPSEKPGAPPVAKYRSPDSTQKKKKANPPLLEHKRNFKIDINKADSATWRQLYGIGPVLSARIVKFRNALGGFYSISQIKEVYGLPDSAFDHIRPHLELSENSLKKININSATVDQLKSHPYIDYRLAAAIKAFREMHGPYDSLPELKDLQLVDDEIYRKLAPYLTVK